MSFEKFLFYFFALITVAAASMVITRRNPVHSVLFLVLTFVSTAVLWMLMEAEFLAIALVLVYVGAVMVLFLFVVMMLDIDVATMKARFIKYLPVGLVVAVVMLGEILMVVGGESWFGADRYPKPAPLPADFSNTESLGEVLYTVYMYPFEIAAVILLVAIVAAIGLTMRKRPDTKYLDPSLQVRVKKGPDRVKMVSVPAEKRMDAE
jgi:NADH-quinone oxidoreductase subunit J